MESLISIQKIMVSNMLKTTPDIVKKERKNHAFELATWVNIQPH